MKGSWISLSGLVQLPPKDGCELKVPQEETDESEAFEQADSGRRNELPNSRICSMVQLDSSRESDCVVRICAGGVLGADLTPIAGTRSRLLGVHSSWGGTQRPGGAESCGNSIEGRGKSEEPIPRYSRLGSVKMFIRGLWKRHVECWGGGGIFGSISGCFGVCGSYKSPELKVKSLGKVRDRPGCLAIVDRCEMLRERREFGGYRLETGNLREAVFGW